MSESTDNVRVRIVSDDLTPVPVLTDEALKMMDDLSEQMAKAETDVQRFWLCCALSAAEQLACSLMAHGGNECARWRTPRQISQDYFGRIVSCAEVRHVKPVNQPPRAPAAMPEQRCPRCNGPVHTGPCVA